MEEIAPFDAVGDEVHVRDGVHDAALLRADDDTAEVRMDDVGAETLEFRDEQQEELLHVVVEGAT